MPHLVVRWEGEGQTREPICFCLLVFETTKICFGSTKFENYATKGPLPIAADRAFFLKSASGMDGRGWSVGQDMMPDADDKVIFVTWTNILWANNGLD